MKTSNQNATGSCLVLARIYPGQRLLFLVGLMVLAGMLRGVSSPRSPVEANEFASLPASQAVSAGQVSIVDMGAVGDGATMNTRSIQAAIDRAAAMGGGTVVIPRGVFLSGALFLKPGVNLHFSRGGVLKASTDMTNFPPQRVRIEGHFEAHYTPALINADGCDGLQISGEGTLDGNGKPIWDQFWQLRRHSKNPGNFPNLSIPRAQLCAINHSEKVLIQGVTFKDSQFWNLHLYNCRNVTVNGSRFQVPDDYKQAPSTDGIDVDSCQDVRISNCFFSVTDDCIALKGSKGPFAMNDVSSPPVEDVRITGCTFKRGGGVTLGSEATVVRNVVVENCRFIGPVNVLNFKLRPDTPQCYEDIHYDNIVLDAPGGVIVSIKPWTQYFNLQGQPPPQSVVRNISLSHVTGHFGAFGLIQGNQGQTRFGDIQLENFDVKLKNGRLQAPGLKSLEMFHVLVNGSMRPSGRLDSARPPGQNVPGAG